SARAFLSQHGGIKRVRALRFSEPSFDRTAWIHMAELGWPRLRLSEVHGGLGLGMRELCGLCEELGAQLAPEPLIGAMLSATLLACSDTSGGRLEPLLSGRRLILTAWQESTDGLEVHGSQFASRLFVPGGFAADVLLVPVQSENGLSLVEVDPRDVEFIALRTQDGGQVCPVHPAPSFSGILLAEDASADMARALDEAALATAAYMLGMSDAAFAITLDYMRTRRQFDRPIGSFQALRHRAADLKIQIELMRASIASAAAVLDAGARPGERSRAVSRAKARASAVVMQVTQEAIQIHGAIGYTDEHDIGLYLRKAMVLANQFGSAIWHRRRHAELSASGSRGIVPTIA
ncbi:MAG: acyl-CoA dehydrogenase, partial [Burkholderiales bacterium]|nr:acyl-CoA dehydrogenase [Burkholderiales bacterium]